MKIDTGKNKEESGNLTEDEVKRMLKGKAPMQEESVVNQKEMKQKKKQADWFRLLSQYSIMERRNDIVIKETSEDNGVGNEGSKKVGSGGEWVLVNEEENNIPMEIEERVLYGNGMNGIDAE